MGGGGGSGGGAGAEASVAFIDSMDGPVKQQQQQTSAAAQATSEQRVQQLELELAAARSEAVALRLELQRMKKLVGGVASVGGGSLWGDLRLQKREEGGAAEGSAVDGIGKGEVSSGPFAPSRKPSTSPEVALGATITPGAAATAAAATAAAAAVAAAAALSGLPVAGTDEQRVYQLCPICAIVPHDLEEMLEAQVRLSHRYSTASAVAADALPSSAPTAASSSGPGGGTEVPDSGRSASGARGDTRDHCADSSSSGKSRLGRQVHGGVAGLARGSQNGAAQPLGDGDSSCRSDAACGSSHESFAAAPSSAPDTAATLWSPETNGVHDSGGSPAAGGTGTTAATAGAAAAAAAVAGFQGSGVGYESAEVLRSELARARKELEVFRPMAVLNLKLLGRVKGLLEEQRAMREEADEAAERRRATVRNLLASLRASEVERRKLREQLYRSGGGSSSLRAVIDPGGCVESAVVEGTEGAVAGVGGVGSGCVGMDGGSNGGGGGKKTAAAAAAGSPAPLLASVDCGHVVAELRAAGEPGVEGLEEWDEVIESEDEEEEYGGSGVRGRAFVPPLISCLFGGRAMGVFAP